MTTSTELHHTRVITFRAVLLGLISVLTISIVVPYFQYTMASSMLGADHFHIGALFLVFFYLILFNVILRRWRADWALTPQEFVVPLVMGMAASGLTTNGMGAPFISTLMAPYLLATPENQWADYFYDYLKPWATVTDQGNALTWFVDGAPPGADIPWSVWGVPLFWWLTLIIPIIFMTLCVAAQGGLPGMTRETPPGEWPGV